MLRRSHPSAGRRGVTEEGEPQVTAALPRVPESVSDARRLVRHTLADWRLSVLADVAELVVSELSSNAVEHARLDTFRVTVQRGTGDRVRVAVTDKSTVLPVVRPLDDKAEGGRGLALVDAVSCKWGTDRLGWGKRVWADLEPPAPDDLTSPGSIPTYPTVRAYALYGLMLIVVALGGLIALAVAFDTR
ncbi:ATP-binding protein [Streptomyces broussonetiae]|uniref:ATP-binding protein n=1 Tax=Streptomyces broussonetiae TaxID=2686304 RepID=A0A6I6N8X4_9ACTN|nr:ATP-binding protein [Streptomyces broussonetiae]